MYILNDFAKTDPVIQSVLKSYTEQLQKRVTEGKSQPVLYPTETINISDRD